MAAPPSLEDAFAEADAEEEMRRTMPSSAPPKAKSAARTPRQPLGSVNGAVRLPWRADCDALPLQLSALGVYPLFSHLFLIPLLLLFDTQVPSDAVERIGQMESIV
jgi:hypothetical protein